jgi:hypothetical protein
VSRRASAEARVKLVLRQVRIGYTPLFVNRAEQERLFGNGRTARRASAAARVKFAKSTSTP